MESFTNIPDTAMLTGSLCFGVCDGHLMYSCRAASIPQPHSRRLVTGPVPTRTSQRCVDISSPGICYHTGTSINATGRVACHPCTACAVQQLAMACRDKSRSRQPGRQACFCQGREQLMSWASQQPLPGPVRLTRRLCLQQLAAVIAAAIATPAQAAIVDEEVAQRVFDSAGESLPSQGRRGVSLLMVPSCD